MGTGFSAGAVEGEQGEAGVRGRFGSTPPLSGVSLEDQLRPGYLSFKGTDRCSVGFSRQLRTRGHTGWGGWVVSQCRLCHPFADAENMTVGVWLHLVQNVILDSIAV